jgi:hypothetical protein
MIKTLILLPFAVRGNLFVTRWFIVAPSATFHCANHVSYIRTRTHEKYASCTLDLLWVTLQPACWVSVWELSLTCELPYANTRVIIVRLPVSTDWLTDAFTRGGHLWDTLQPACWLTDASSRGGPLWDTNYTSCRSGVPSGILTCDLPYANTCVIIVWHPVSHKLHVLSTRSTQWNFNLWFDVCKHTRYNCMTPCELQITRLVDAEYPVEL